MHRPDPEPGGGVEFGSAPELALQFASDPALWTNIHFAAPEGTFRYRDLIDASAAVAARLLTGGEDLDEARAPSWSPPASPTWPCSGASGGPAEWPCRWPSFTRRPNWPTP